MSDVHVGAVRHDHAVLVTVLALIAALVIGAGAVVLYYEAIDSDAAPTASPPVVQVVTPEQVAAARAIDKREAERNVAVLAVDNSAATLAGSPARVEGIGRYPEKK